MSNRIMLITEVCHNGHGKILRNVKMIKIVWRAFHSIFVKNIYNE